MEQVKSTFSSSTIRTGFGEFADGQSLPLTDRFDSASIAIGAGSGNETSRHVDVDPDTASLAPSTIGGQSEFPEPDTFLVPVALGSDGSTITGKADPLSLVTVSDSDRVIGEAISSADGSWSMPWLGSQDMDVHSLRAVSSHNHRHGHHHADHGTPVSAGAPSIAGISDSTQGSHGKFSRVATIDNPLPTIIGFGHAGDIVTILDGDHSIGSTTVHSDGTWVFSTPLLSKGTHDFCVIAVSSVSGVTLMSNHLVVKMIGDSTPLPLAVATITSALDEFTDPSGHLHQTVIQNGGKTPDTSPKLVGTLSGALHEGEVLYVYRDGQKLGAADVSGNAWSFQDMGVAAGSHAYKAHVETAAGAHGASSSEFSLTKAELTGSPDKLPVLVGENFLMVDIRLMRATTSNGLPMTFDLEESVRFMKLQGLDVKSYSQNQDFITFEVDWMSYAAGHLNDNLMFVSHQHVDNGSGGLDYYATVGLAPFTELLRQLGGWIPTTLLMDGAAMQSPLPPVDVHIGGVYDGLTLVPDGGSASGTAHTLVGTLSGTITHAGAYDYGYIVIYRDGVKIAASMIGFRSVTVNDTEWTFEDRDVPPGPHVYTAQIARTYGKQGTMSEGYHIVETVETPLPVATITSALDEFTDPGGNHHDNVIQNGGKTADTSPKLIGTLNAALHEGDVLAIYRDGQKVGTASVAGLGWSYRDDGLTTGQHVYTAIVIAASGEQGVHSGDFVVTETAGTSFDMFPMLGTEDFLIFDTRLIPRTTSDGRPISFDLLETVKIFEKEGMTVKSYTDDGGFISIEVNWVEFMKTHSNMRLDLVSHRHIDNDKGGLNYYNSFGFSSWQSVLAKLGTWTFAVFGADGAEGQRPTPAPATTITGIYEVYTDPSGNPALSLVPDGGSTASSTHKIMFAFSGSLGEGWTSDSWEIYRDGVRLLPNKDLLDRKYDLATNTGWVIETNVPPGPHVYTARVPRSYGDQGPWSPGYEILELAPESSAVATITSALDEFVDPAGVHHDSTVKNGGQTSDTSPELHGTLSASLHEGDVLAIFRDGQKIGTASVTGLGWFYQDHGLTTGQHVYTASVISASGEQGVHSADFVITETAGTSFGSFQFLATEDFLIFDTRFVAKTTSDGKAISVDMLEAVRILEKAGMTVKSYTDNGGVISIEVDWIAYVKAHPAAYFDLPLHRHIDNDHDGLDHYNLVAVPDFGILLNLLGQWKPAYFVQDAGGQSPTPAAAATITGVFDFYVDTEGHVQLSLIPAGGASSETSHRIEGTLSEPMNKWSDSLVIYRDGEKLTGDNHSFNPLSDHSNTTWWIIDNDAPPGPHVYTARVEREFEAQGPWSSGYEIRELAPVSSTVATITSALDEFIDPAGNHHDNVIQNGGKTVDTSPKLLGTINFTLQPGEVLVVYRDGVKLGHADVSDLGWSFQDKGVAAGEYTYTARVESPSSAPGAMSESFGIVEAPPKTFSTFPVMATEDFLIFDTRIISRTTPTGESVTFDLMESVKSLEKAGMTVKSYTEQDGFISIEVDWLAFAKTHPYDNVNFVSHRHIDNDKGGLNYYDTLGVLPFDYMARQIGNWVETVYVYDGASTQSPLPPATTTITGIYGLHTDASGNPIQSLVPDGGSSDSSSYKIVGTFSVPLGAWDSMWDVYRDGVRLLPGNGTTEFEYDRATNVWWVIETGVAPGQHVYTARVHRTYGEQGVWSEGYNVLETSPVPLVIETIATISYALDEFTDPAGNHHQTVIENGSKTLDTSPKLLGTLTATLLDGEALYVYRDGIKLGPADVSGQTWSFQDDGVAVGSHTYTTRVESNSGAQGPLSSDFSLIEATAGESEKLPLLVTEHFLILDVRGLNWVTASGQPIVPDLTETVNGLNKLGLAAKINSSSDSYISIEVDWMAYAENHPGGRIDFVLNLHIDNDNGGLNYYKSINVPSFGGLLKVIDTWVPTNFMGDGAEWQSATPAPATVITGVYDSYTGADGKPQFTLVPEGGGTAESTHRIEGTLSAPMRMTSDWLVIYRDGIKVSGQANAYEMGKTYSNTTWWFIDKDVPPGPHVYTARVERAYGKQGDWSESYGILNANGEPLPDVAPPLLMLTEGALIIDVHSLTPPTAGSSAASLGLSAELVAGGKTVAVLAITADAAGMVSFAADWKTVVATHPDATLKISALIGPDDAPTILDKHALSSLLGQTDRWVSMTPTGENAAFFDASDRSVHMHGGAGIDTIAIAGDHQVLDLTSLTGKTTASTVMGIDKIDLGGQHNTLKIAMIDVLNLGATDHFREDGKQQLMVNGKAGDSINLSNTRVAGIADGDWEQQAETKIGGVRYDVYEHSTAHVELMVQSGIQLTMQ